MAADKQPSLLACVAPLLGLADTKTRKILEGVTLSI